MEPFSTSSSPAGGPSGDAATILLLDDEDSFRGALAETLRDEGYTVLEYATPAALPPLSDVAEIGVVVTDYQMPGTDGLAFSDVFHAARPMVPIIMLTSYCTRLLEAQAAQRDFICLRRKPLDYSEFQTLLHRLAPDPAAHASKVTGSRAGSSES